MFATLFTTLTLLAVGTRAALELDTPDSVTQCKDVKLTFRGNNGDKGPFILAVVPGDDVCDDAFVEIPSLTGSEYTWKVNRPAGSKVAFVIEDLEGHEAWSGSLTVKESSDTSCLKADVPGGVEASPTGIKTLPPSGTQSSPSVKNTGAPAPPPPANAGSNPNDNNDGAGTNAASTSRISMGVAVAAALLALSQL